MDLIELAQEKRLIVVPFETDLDEWEGLGEDEDETIDRSILIDDGIKDLK